MTYQDNGVLVNFGVAVPQEIKSLNFSDESNWFGSYIETDLQFKRFNVGTRNSKRFNFSLNWFGNGNLIKNSLISRDVHRKHADKLNVRFQRKIGGIIKKERARIRKYGGPSKAGSFAVDEHSIAGRRVRFLTVIHSLVGLNVEDALRATKELKNDIVKTIRQVDGVACLGALEIEVVSIRNMRRLRSLNSCGENRQFALREEPISADVIKLIQTEDDSCDDEKLKEFRKLDVCEGLGQHLSESVLGGEFGCLLIHFHGLVTVTKESQLDEVLNVLNENPRWKIKPRQIRFQKLRKTHRGEYKSVKLSLEHLARYFTKGGNDLHDGKSYLQYKIKFPKGTALTYEEQLIEWAKHDYLGEEIDFDEGATGLISNPSGDIDNPKTNFLSLSVKEVNVLASLIDATMHWNTTGTGYLVTVGRW